MGMEHVKKSVMVYRKLFEAYGIHHSKSGHQMTHDMYIYGYCMVLFFLTLERSASESHASHTEKG